MYLNPPTKILIICLVVFKLSACSSNQARTVYDSRFDFSQVKNYGFYNNDSEFFNSQSIDYAQRSRVELAIEKNLSKQNLQYINLEQADIIITYHLVSKKYKDYQAYNKAVLFCSYCLIANTWVTQDEEWKVYPDGLIIDLVDPKNNRSVWRSIYPMNYSIKDNSNKQNNKIINAVNTMLMQYPNSKIND
ncbi:DUF4136 domain-containing protein [Colwellia sp. E2M01]|nr:DUF4136 domain-containing protein [Colwellia sp. E2M01]